MRRLGLQNRVGGDVFRCFYDLLVVGGDETCFDRRLRARAAFEQAAFDQQHVRALAGRGHHSTLPRRAWDAEQGRRVAAPSTGQASFTVSVLTSLPSASNTLATMLLASRPARAYIAFGESWSRNSSGSTIERIS